jgi:hypothetical protein
MRWEPQLAYRSYERQRQTERDVAFLAANPNWQPPTFRLICVKCRRGPRDGVALRRMAWILRCDECPLPRRKL